MPHLVPTLSLDEADDATVIGPVVGLLVVRLFRRS
jgi:hypothetical protein